MAVVQGVTFKDVYWTVGQYDMVVILEGVDEAVTTGLLKLGSLGNVRSQTLRGFSAEERRALWPSLLFNEPRITSAHDRTTGSRYQDSPALTLSL